jgi:hypothetical protein
LKSGRRAEDHLIDIGRNVSGLIGPSSTTPGFLGLTSAVNSESFARRTALASLTPKRSAVRRDNPPAIATTTGCLRLMERVRLKHAGLFRQQEA